MRTHVRCLYSLGSLLVLLIVATAAPAAAASSSDISGSVTQSYSAGPSVLKGMIVELQPKNPATVIPLTAKDIRSIVGVVVPVNDATIVLTPQTVSTQQVLVASSGRYDLLVSNQGGPVKVGDYITISALPGIGMKADADQSEIVGRAVGDFNGSSNVVGTVSLKSSLGRSTAVTIGHIPVDVHLAPNPLFEKNKNSLPNVLNKIASSVANKSVASARVYLSIAVLIATFFITSSIFYGGARSGMVAVGRNPLAKRAINRGLIKTVGVGMIIFAVGIFAVYLILRL